MNEKKKLMILGASELQLPLIKRAKERGLFVIVVSPGKQEKGKFFADYGIDADVRDEQYIYERAKELHIDGIITDQTDVAVRTVAFVAEKLGLSGIGYKTACLFTDKYAMREKCKELGIKTLKYKLVDNLEDAINFFNDAGEHLILKPTDSQGSRGVSLIDSKEKLIEKFQEAIFYSKSKKLLLEQVASGREFVVEGLTYNYKFNNLMIGDTYYFGIPDVFSATQRVFPTNAEIQLKEKVLELNKKIIEGFGLKQGISHSEFIMDGDDVVLIETAARGGGVFISSDLIPLSTGLCTEDFLIDIALGELKDLPNVQENLSACCYLAFYLPVGTVTSTKGIKEIRELNYTHRDNLSDIVVGMVTKPHIDKTSRYYITVSAKNRVELDKEVEYIRKTLNNIKVILHNGEEEGPIWF